MWNHSVHYYCSGVISAARAQRARVLRSRPACTCVRACSRACVWLTRVNIERHTNKQANKTKTTPGHCVWISSPFIIHAVHLHVSGHSDSARSLPHSIMSELKDCPPLKYYDFKPVEHVKVCPRYTAVLGRSEDDGIGIEELDTLQLELETLLSSASRRLRALEEQRQVGESREAATVYISSLVGYYL